MSENTAVEALLAKKQELIDEKQKAIEKFDAEITDLDIAIETLGGDRFMSIPAESRYDDESPNYIKSSQEEI